MRKKTQKRMYDDQPEKSDLCSPIMFFKRNPLEKKISVTTTMRDVKFCFSRERENNTSEVEEEAPLTYKITNLKKVDDEEKKNISHTQREKGKTQKEEEI